MNGVTSALLSLWYINLTDGVGRASSEEREKV
jgi:hypothetical protein